LPQAVRKTTAKQEKVCVFYLSTFQKFKAGKDINCEDNGWAED
jgi:hypothetical protein